MWRCDVYGGSPFQTADHMISSLPVLMHSYQNHVLAFGDLALLGNLGSKERHPEQLKIIKRIPVFCFKFILNLQSNIFVFKNVKKKLMLISLPGIVLSKMNATEPPTNMAVVRRTFNTWSISTIPVKIEEEMDLFFQNITKAKHHNSLAKIVEIKITARKTNSMYKCIWRSSRFVSMCVH